MFETSFKPEGSSNSIVNFIAMEPKTWAVLPDRFLLSAIDRGISMVDPVPEPVSRSDGLVSTTVKRST